jgi:hypothetical protein
MLRLDLLAPLLAFAALLLAAALLALSASGHFPRRIGKVTGPGALALWASLAAGLAAVGAGLAAAWRLLPWPSAVIAGGLAILVAPLVLQQFSDRFVDGRGALAVFAAVAVASALILALLSGQPA